MLLIHKIESIFYFFDLFGSFQYHFSYFHLRLFVKQIQGRGQPLHVQSMHIIIRLRAGRLPSCVLKQNATKANIPFYGRYFFHILLVVIEVYR